VRRAVRPTSRVRVRGAPGTSWSGRRVAGAALGANGSPDCAARLTLGDAICVDRTLLAYSMSLAFLACYWWCWTDSARYAGFAAGFCSVEISCRCRSAGAADATTRLT
jgi:hypothetical protein